jgi:hypothetical protein
VRCVHTLLLVAETSADLRSLFGRHLRPDPARVFDFVANAIVGVHLLVRPRVLGDVADRHG